MGKNADRRLRRLGRRRCSALALGLALALGAGSARAIDTTETWDPHAFDVEAYTHVDHVLRRDRASGLDAVVGYGLARRFSGYVAGGIDASEGRLSMTPAFGIFGTVLDTDHVDLDLFLAATYEGHCAALTPAFELNLDAEPDLASWGIFIRGDSSAHAHWIVRTLHAPDDPEPWTIGLNLGAYVTVADGHQLLAELDGEWVPTSSAPPGAETFAIGYNVRLSDQLELITALSLDGIMSPAERAPGVLIGAIATLPPR